MSFTNFGGASLTAFSSKRFPENVGTDEVPNYIIFTPQKIQFGNLDNYGNNFSTRIRANVGGAVGGAISRGVGSFFGGIFDAVDGVVNTIANASNSFLNNLTRGTGINFNVNFPSVTSGLRGSVGRIISGTVNVGSLEIGLGLSQERNVVQNLGSIALYMPKSLASNLTVDVNDKPLGATGATAAEIIRERGYNSAAGLTEAATSGVAAVITDLTRSQFREPFQVATGRVANQFTYAIFNGVKHREFTYEFQLVAKNQRESDEIKAICDLFMYHMLPEKSNSTDFHFYEIPNQWVIQYQRMGTDLEHYAQPNACFLKDVKIAYGSDTNMMTHTDGSPLNVKLTLSFLEIQPMHRGGSGRTLTNAQAGISSQALPIDSSGGNGPQ